MIICSGCGHANSSADAFCQSCGGFLEWDGQQVPAQRLAAPATVVSTASDRAAPLVDIELRESHPPVKLPALPSLPRRAPEAEQERIAPVRPEAIDLGPADLYCGACGAGNADGRHFCRRCGASLVDAVPAGRARWWRRLWRAVMRLVLGRRQFAAGERPARWDRHGPFEPADGRAASTDGSGSGGAQRKKWRRPRMPTRLNLGKLAIPLALLSLIGFGIAPVRAAVMTKGFDLFARGRAVVAPRFVVVTPASATASSSLNGHGPDAAIDQNLLTWWSEGGPTRGHGEVLVVRFDRPEDLARITVHNGAAEASYPFQPRVRSVRITLFGARGVVQESRALLADTRGRQTLSVSGHAVTRVELRIVSTYAGQKGRAASLSEVGFVSKQ